MKKSELVVYKFGGTSVKSFVAMSEVARIIAGRKHNNRIVLTSALSGVTDSLTKIIASIHKQDRAALEKWLVDIEQRHDQLLADLKSNGELDQVHLSLYKKIRASLRPQIEKIFADGMTPSRGDIILSFGERLSAALLTMVFKQQGMHAVFVESKKIVKTNNDYGSAQPDIAATKAAADLILRPLLADNCVIILQGFIGQSPSGKVTTLGRGGSDFSATIVGAAIGADRVEIWTDVDGVMTCDPRVVAHAQSLNKLNFAEASELAYFGAKVLHPSTLLPAMVDNIPVAVKNTKRPHAQGTVILPELKDEQFSGVKSIAFKRSITVINIISARMLMAHGFLREVFAIFDRHKTPVDLVTTSEVSVSVTIDNDSRIANIQAELEAIGEVQILQKQTIVSLVGSGIRNHPGVLSRTFTAIKDVNITMISLGASKNNLSFVVHELQLEEVVRCLHRTFFEDIMTEEKGAEATACV